jgi:hypothetical protein
MDIGDFIFIFIFILVIIGRVLSFIFKQFVENEPDDGSEKAPSKPQGMKDYIVEWIRSLEDHVSETTHNQWNSHVTQSVDNEWETFETHEKYEALESPANVPEKHHDLDTQPKSVKVVPSPKNRVLKKRQFRQMNLKEAMIHYEIFSPPISLRQENQYDRQF